MDCFGAAVVTSFTGDASVVAGAAGAAGAAAAAATAGGAAGSSVLGLSSETAVGADAVVFASVSFTGEAAPLLGIASALEAPSLLGDTADADALGAADDEAAPLLVAAPAPAPAPPPVSSFGLPETTSPQTSHSFCARSRILNSPSRGISGSCRMRFMTFPILVSRS